MLRLDNLNEILEKLLIHDHSGPACITKIHVLCSWQSDDPTANFTDFDFGPAPNQHVPLAYHPIDEPPVALPANAAGWVPTEVVVDNDDPTPELHLVCNRRATPYPARTGASSSSAPAPAPMLALPWYGIGGVPHMANSKGEVVHPGEHEEVMGANDDDTDLEKEEPDDITTAMAGLGVETAHVFTAAASTEGEHESRAQKRRTRSKRAKDSACKLRRSLRLKEKEKADFELLEDKALRVQHAKFDYTGASRRLRNFISKSYLISDYPYPSDDDQSLYDIAVAYGANAEEIDEINDATAGPSTAP